MPAGREYSMFSLAEGPRSSSIRGSVACCHLVGGVALVAAANQQASHPVSVRWSWLIVNNVNRYWPPVGGWLSLRDQPIVSHIVPSTHLTPPMILLLLHYHLQHHRFFKFNVTSAQYFQLSQIHSTSHSCLKMFEPVWWWRHLISLAGGRNMAGRGGHLKYHTASHSAKILAPFF